MIPGNQHNFSTILGGIIGFLIAVIWLVNQAILVAWNFDVFDEIDKYFNKNKILLPAIFTLILPFVIANIFQQAPDIARKLDKFVGVIGAISGASLGFLLSEWRQWRTGKRQAVATRTLLSLEIHQNLGLLREFCHKIHEINELEQGSELALLNVNRLAELSWPQWSRNAWNSLLSVLPQALKDEQAIKQVNYFYNQLDTITAICHNLSKVSSELSAMNCTIMQVTPNNQADVMSHVQYSESLKKKALKQCIECEQVVRNLLDSGNPL